MLMTCYLLLFFGTSLSLGACQHFRDDLGNDLVWKLYPMMCLKIWQMKGTTSALARMELLLCFRLVFRQAQYVVKYYP